MGLRALAVIGSLFASSLAQPAAGQNLLVNPRFDGSIQGWEVRDAANAYSPLDANGMPGSGSGITPEGEAIHQCVAITPDRVYDFGASALIPAGQTRSAPATVGVVFRTSCAATSTAVSFGVGVSSSVVGSWNRLEGRAYAPPGARFATLNLSIGKAGPGDVLKGQFDDAYLAVTSAACPVVWTYPSLTVAPPGRSGFAMAYDATRDRTVVFGGDGVDGVLSDTWTWDGAAFTAQPVGGPEARGGAAAVYDSARAVVLLFGGGRSTNGQVQHFRETWEWNGSAWTARTQVGPPGRRYHAMAYDSARARVVLFGGDADHHPLDDTWEWDGSGWSEVSVTGERPSARFGHAMAYDARRGRVVLYGGAVASGVSDETWEWDGARWTRALVAAAPPARYGAALAYDSSRGEIVLYAGAAGSSAFAAPEIWRFDGRDWLRQELLGSTVRSGHALAYDEGRRRMVAFGGLTTGGQAIGVIVERLAPAPLERLVPIVLDVFSGTAHFTTELAITNRGSSALGVSFRYTASLGGLLGSGTAEGLVEPGSQLVVPDVLAFLRTKGARDSRWDRRPAGRPAPPDVLVRGLPRPGGGHRADHHENQRSAAHR